MKELIEKIEGGELQEGSGSDVLKRLNWIEREIKLAKTTLKKHQSSPTAATKSKLEDCAGKIGKYHAELVSEIAKLSDGFPY